MARPNTSNRKILDAAADAFSSRGYHLTSMDDIARGAGVAKGTLYYNFTTKATLFRAVVAEGMEHLMHEVARAVETDAPVLDQVQTVIELNVRTFAEHPQITRIMQNELSGGLDVEIREYVVGLRTRYREFFAGLLALGVREGVVRDLNRELLAMILIDIIFSAASYLADHRDSMTEAEVSNFILTLLVSGAFVRR